MASARARSLSSSSSATTSSTWLDGPACPSWRSTADPSPGSPTRPGPTSGCRSSRRPGARRGCRPAPRPGRWWLRPATRRDPGDRRRAVDHLLDGSRPMSRGGRDRARHRARRVPALDRGGRRARTRLCAGPALRVDRAQRPGVRHGRAGRLGRRGYGAGVRHRPPTPVRDVQRGGGARRLAVDARARVAPGCRAARPGRGRRACAGHGMCRRRAARHPARPPWDLRAAWVGTSDVTWPAGYTSVFVPELRVLGPDGAIVAGAGDEVRLTGAVDGVEGGRFVACAVQRTTPGQP